MQLRMRSAALWACGGQHARAEWRGVRVRMHGCVALWAMSICDAMAAGISGGNASHLRAVAVRAGRSMVLDTLAPLSDPAARMLA